jgi:SAM-dependent methyltransferase
VARPPQPDFEALAGTWEALGQDDPLWAVLQFSGKEGGRWDPDEFLRHGEREIDRVLGVVEEHGWSLNHGSALDFGCGAGRLTQALCRHFEHVDGVDIAPSMIEAAERLNRYPDKCTYHLNKAQNLALFPDASFDFLYSILVLQHMHPTFARGYVSEFVRLLAPGGLALFEITTGISKSVSETLPRAGFAASQAVLGEMPREISTGDVLTLEVRVTNTSPATWPTHGERAVRLGARWRQGSGSSPTEEARKDFAGDLGPGVAETVTLAVRAPRTPGRYTLELGLLQEDVAWFVDRGGPLTRAEVTVLPGDTSGPSARAEPHVEMYVTPAAEVTRWVDEAGGRVVSLLSADQPEVGYEGGLFVATRQAADM